MKLILHGSCSGSRRVHTLVIGLAMGLLALGATATTASAAPPPECQSAFLQGTYTRAFDSYKAAMHSLFQSSFGCQAFESFVTYARGSVPPPPTGDISLYCENRGRRDAVEAALDEIRRQCAGGRRQNCAANGVERGETLAKNFCAPPFPGWSAPPPPLPLCTIIQRETCKAVFASYVSQHCPARMSDPLYAATFALCET